MEPKACHIALPEESSAEAQKFVCALARHVHSRGRLCSFDMPKDLEGVGAVQVFLDRSRQYERSECWGFVAHRLANYSLSGFEINKEGLFPKSSAESLCDVSPYEKRRAEASLHARCLAEALAGVPRWGASQASTTELE